MCRVGLVSSTSSLSGLAFFAVTTSAHATTDGLSQAGSGHSHILRSKDYTPSSLASISRARPAPPQDAQQSSPSPYPHRPHIVYTVLFSRVAEALRSRITHSDTVLDRLTYRNALDGRQAVDEIAYVIKTTDRNLVPRALDEQKYFHAVTHHV